MTQATAVAHPNIALVKYWGKFDRELILPAASSLSMTLDTVPTTTTVEISPDLDTDTFYLGGSPATPTQTVQVTKFLDRVRQLAGVSTRATVISHNEAPTAAGLASSASGFAALALAASTAYGLQLNTRELSILARHGSGSACRSVIDRFAVWHAGINSRTSYAEAITAPDMRMVICQIDGAPKPVSSRRGMQLTRDTSPFWDGWVKSTTITLQDMLAACAADDFTRVGELAELHSLRMHAVIQSSNPPLRYLAPTSYAVMDKIVSLRQQGIECYATADAGPNVVAICPPHLADRVARELTEYGTVHTAAPGPGAYLTDSHLTLPTEMPR